MRSTRLGARSTRAAPGAWRPNGPVRPSRTGVRLGEGRAPARPGFACPAPAIGCRVPAFIPYAHVLQPARLPLRARSPQRTRPPQRKRPPRQARRRRPGTAPRTSSRTPPQSAAPPQAEIPLRNNLFSALLMDHSSRHSCVPPVSGSHESRPTGTWGCHWSRFHISGDGRLRRFLVESCLCFH